MSHLPLAFHIPAGGIFAGGFGLIVLLVLALSVFWIWMLVDCITSRLPSTEKLIWVLVILFTHILGAILYFAIARGGNQTA